MITKKIKEFKKVSYFCLTLFSTVLPSSTEAADSLSRDNVDHPVIGGSIRVPRQKESVLDSLEKKVRLLFEDYDTKDNDVERNFKSPPMDNHRQQYRDLHNSIVDKYTKQNPEFVRRRLPPKQENEASNLVSASEEFLRKARELREAQELENKKLQKVGETIVKSTAYGLKAVVDNKVEDPEAKGFFLDLLDKAKEQVLNLFIQ